MKLAYKNHPARLSTLLTPNVSSVEMEGRGFTLIEHGTVWYKARPTPADSKFILRLVKEFLLT